MTCLHSMVSDPWVHAPGWARCHNLGHLFKICYLIFLTYADILPTQMIRKHDSYWTI